MQAMEAETELVGRDKSLANLGRRKNDEYRADEFLTEAQVLDLADCAWQRARKAQKDRDRLVILMSFYHGLRVSEVVGMKWADVNLSDGTLRVRRAKGGVDGTHPLYGLESEILQRMDQSGEFVFMTERKTRMTDDGVRRFIERTTQYYGLEHKPHPHMLRHSCGYWLVNSDVELRKIQVYLGHRSITSTTIYTSLKKDAFDGLRGIDPFAK
jgi:type 1 fimbriae regulatory protein FimB/type 1 fimbriae regulatory protein FimE